MKRHSARVAWKMLRYMLLPVLLVIVGMCYLVSVTEQDINLQEKQFLAEIAEQSANGIHRTVDFYLDRMEAIANIIGNSENYSQSYTLDVLKLECARAGHKRMGFATPNGDAAATDGQTFNIADRDFFVSALSGVSGVSNRLVDKVDGAYINVYAVPLYVDGVLEGVIFATNDNSNFTKYLSTPIFGGAGFSFVITRDGDPVGYAESKDGFEEFTNLFDEIRDNGAAEQDVLTMQQNMAKDKSGIITYHRGGVERVAAYSEIGANDWYAITVVPTSIISESSRRIILRNSLLVGLTTVSFLGMMVLIVLQSRKNARRLELIAYGDALTGYENFNGFRERAQYLLESNPQVSYVFTKLDVYNFKLINERFGFETGDQVLKNMAKAIAANQQSDTAPFARINVDEFIIMYPYEGRSKIEEIRKGVAQEFHRLMGPGFHDLMRFPTGCYIADAGETSFGDVFEKVNYAHRQAKLRTAYSGAAEFFYDDAAKKKAVREAEIENKMEAALENHAFQVYLQPKYALKDETIVGAEALVRWQETAEQLVSPGEFIPLFERNGFIIKLDFYMFERVCGLIRDWMERGVPVVTVSVNFSRLHLANGDFIDSLVQIARRYGVPAEYIELELTETVVLDNEELLQEVLEQIHRAGFTFSMDDFGTGYSSLGLLKNLPVDVIKMDRSFFVEAKSDARAISVIEGVMSIAKNLHITTVAEGVEKREQIEMLRGAGCDIVQGYYYAAPMAVEKFTARMLETSQPEALA